MITIIGSITMDLVTISKRLPNLGETIFGEKFSMFPGGKGANQAMAAAKLGNKVNLIGFVGNDNFGNILLNKYQEKNINIEGIKKYDNISTGIATINVVNGKNNIIIIPGANYKLSWEYIKKHLDIINKSKIIILQHEIPKNVINKIIEYCYKKNIKTILNPAPAFKISKDIVDKVSYLIPNEHEFEIMFGNNNYLEQCYKYPNKLIITLGVKGSVSYDGIKEIRSIIPKVKALDSTGAGDTFIGTFAHGIVNGFNLEEAIQLATNAASLSVTKIGAQEGMPTLNELKKFIKDIENEKNTKNN